MKTARILAAIGLRFGLFRLQLGSLRGLGCGGFLLGLIQLSGGYEDGHVGKPVLSSLVTGHDEHLGIEVRVRVTGDLLKLQGVFVAVVRDDVNVSGCVREPLA